ncbi:hypothetical protein [Vibrio sagamiensis]|uniref:Uncharacterized protein n=1 Tax=Vibrio sagamiensis NBRC 104589 TaxID=1219064 RepID=A0A511QB41_9VIBR|nr:hypothetical protein [Vibrio sagamiensis]PNQ53559.1 hypothetical protein C1141_20635 [Vibrio agarivorans]GEM74514.1 hypothetical protein VSA01S_06260 [Vibrio sagamiensis NBRC 104589]
MKASELNIILSQLLQEQDLDVVMGEEWLPERLEKTQICGNMLFLHFDNAPEDHQGDEEGRGFVTHEVNLIRLRLSQILYENCSNSSKIDALLALFLMGHELSSSRIVEILENSSVND